MCTWALGCKALEQSSISRHSMGGLELRSQVGVRALLAIKSPVLVLRLVLKSLISEAKVCFVFYGERRKEEAVGRLQSLSEGPMGKGGPHGERDPTESPTSHGALRKDNCTGELLG